MARNKIHKLRNIPPSCMAPYFVLVGFFKRPNLHRKTRYPHSKYLQIQTSALLKYGLCLFHISEFAGKSDSHAPQSFLAHAKIHPLQAQPLPNMAVYFRCFLECHLYLLFIIMGQSNPI